MKPRVLFVDDDPYILRSLALVFQDEAESWELMFALGSDVALAMLEQFQFDVVVSDLEMPGINGVALLANVKSTSPHAVRVLLTGSGIDPADVDVDLVLAKPYQQDILRETIRTIVDRS